MYNPEKMPYERTERKKVSHKKLETEVKADEDTNLMDDNEKKLDKELKRSPYYRILSEKDQKEARDAFKKDLEEIGEQEKD